MTSLLLVLAFYYQLIQNGNTSPEIIRDYVVVESLVAGVNPQISQGVVKRESGFNCEAIGDHGESEGCWQIHLPAHKSISSSQAKDPIFSTQWSLQEIKENGCKIWTTCAETMKALGVDT